MLVKSTFLGLVFFLAAAGGVQAAYFKLSPASRTVSTGESFQVELIIDTEGQAVVSADAIMIYNPDILAVVDIVDGNSQGQFFPDVFRRIRDNEVYIGAAFFKKEDARAGQGAIATISLRGKTRGDSQVRFECTSGETWDSNITYYDNQNKPIDVIDCGKNISGIYSVVAGGPGPTSTPTLAPTPTPTVVPTITPGGPTPTPTITPGGPTLTPTPTPTPTITSGGPTLTPTLTPTPSPTPLSGGDNPNPTRAPIPTKLPEGGRVGLTVLTFVSGLLLVAVGVGLVIGL